MEINSPSQGFCARVSVYLSNDNYVETQLNDVKFYTSVESVIRIYEFKDEQNLFVTVDFINIIQSLCILLPRYFWI